VVNTFISTTQKGRKVKLNTWLYLVAELKMHGAVPPLLTVWIIGTGKLEVLAMISMNMEVCLLAPEQFRGSNFAP
jgi:hypothetical protein